MKPVPIQTVVEILNEIFRETNRTVEDAMSLAEITQLAILRFQSYGSAIPDEVKAYFERLKKDECNCPLCQRGRAVLELAAKLPEEDGQRLMSIYDGIMDDEEEKDMKLAYFAELFGEPDDTELPSSGRIAAIIKKNLSEKHQKDVADLAEFVVHQIQGYRDIIKNILKS